MEDSKEKNAPWLSVPQFGDWDQKGQLPDYSMDFSKIREMRKQNKTNISRASLGNEEELMASTTGSANSRLSEPPQHPHYHRSHHSSTIPRQHAILVAAHAVDVWDNYILFTGNTAIKMWCTIALGCGWTVGEDAPLSVVLKLPVDRNSTC